LTHSFQLGYVIHLGGDDIINANETAEVGHQQKNGDDKAAFVKRGTL
jgi:hypothetical protein